MKQERIYSSAEHFIRGHQNGVCDCQNILIRARRLSSKMSAEDILQFLDVELDKLRDYSLIWGTEEKNERTTKG